MKKPVAKLCSTIKATLKTETAAAAIKPKTQKKTDCAISSW